MEVSSYTKGCHVNADMSDETHPSIFPCDRQALSSSPQFLLLQVSFHKVPIHQCLKRQAFIPSKPMPTGFIGKAVFPSSLNYALGGCGCLLCIMLWVFHSQELPLSQAGTAEQPGVHHSSVSMDPGTLSQSAVQNPSSSSGHRTVAHALSL